MSDTPKVQGPLVQPTLLKVPSSALLSLILVPHFLSRFEIFIYPVNGVFDIAIPGKTKPGCMHRMGAAPSVSTV